MQVKDFILQSYMAQNILRLGSSKQHKLLTPLIVFPFPLFLTCPLDIELSMNLVKYEPISFSITVSMNQLS